MDRSQVALLIREHNSIEQELLPLRDSETFMQNVDRNVRDTSNKLGGSRGSLSKLQTDTAYMRKRVNRNANPRFLHYLVCNRAAKVERLTGELKDLVVIGDNLEGQIADCTAELSALQQQQQNAHAIVDRKHQLEAKCRSLFDQVVDSQPPTMALQQQRNNWSQQSMLTGAEQGLLQAVSNSIQLINQGLSLFQQADGIYRQATLINMRATQVVSGERFEERRERRDEVFGDQFGAENAERHREELERRERQLQCQRDSLVNEAQRLAMQAYQIINNGFSTFPAEARARYPELCASIGQVTFPRLQGADFSQALFADVIFGTGGAAMNDFSSGCKIQNNVGVVEQCIVITSRQLGLITAMQLAVNMNVQQLQSSMQNIEKCIAAERNNIFNDLITFSDLIQTQ